MEEFFHADNPGILQHLLEQGAVQGHTGQLGML